MTFIEVFRLNDTNTSITLKHLLVWSLITIYQACSLMVVSLYYNNNNNNNNYYYYYYYYYHNHPILYYFHLKAVPRRKGGSLVVATERDFIFLDLEVC